METYGGYTTMPQIGRGFISNLFKKAVPMLTSVAKRVGKGALRAGLNMAEEALNGQAKKRPAIETNKRSGSPNKRPRVVNRRRRRLRRMII
jgi:hypothetical protein